MGGRQVDLEDHLPAEEGTEDESAALDPSERDEGDTRGVGQRDRIVKAAAAVLVAVALLVFLVLLEGGGRMGVRPAAVAPDALAHDVMDSARGELIVRQLRRMYAEEVELYGMPDARDLAVFRDDFIIECVTAADDSVMELVEGATSFNAVEAMEFNTQYCEEVARIAFERAGISSPWDSEQPLRGPPRQPKNMTRTSRTELPLGLSRLVAGYDWLSIPYRVSYVRSGAGDAEIMVGVKQRDVDVRPLLQLQLR